MLLTGNHAAAWGAMLCRPRVVPVYPITPQTPILEKISELQESGRFDVDLMTAESEHSAMSACITASLTGVRVFTATASQGLLLMHEMLHYAAGARAPIVMAEVNRTVGSPWGFWPDQTDSLAQRDTGWIQFYVETPQEALDTVIQAYRVAEQAMLPAMVVQEAFYVSHSLEPVLVPAQDVVDAYLPPFDPEHRLDPDRGESWGMVVSQEMYYRHRQSMDESQASVIELATRADEEFLERCGRTYPPVEQYRTDDAEVVLVCLGSLAGTARVAVDAMRDRGLPVGMLRVKLFNPLPVERLRAAVEGVRKVVVVERNVSPGVGGVLAQSVRASLYGAAQAPGVSSYLAGVGGVNVSPRTLEELVREAWDAEPGTRSIWWR
jgi:pyruvate/2-oxoacid:ferredoxin oxidoreductase alpha subunit